MRLSASGKMGGKAAAAAASRRPLELQPLLAAAEGGERCGHLSFSPGTAACGAGRRLADAGLGGGAGTALPGRRGAVGVPVVRLDQQVLYVLHDQTDGHCNTGTEPSDAAHSTGRTPADRPHTARTAQHSTDNRSPNTHVQSC